MTTLKPYKLRKCVVCGTPFILGPLDPDVNVCPFHAYRRLKGNPKKLKSIKNPFSRMRKKLRRKRRKH